MRHSSSQATTALPYLLPALMVLALVGGVPLGLVAYYAVHDTFGGNVFVWVGADWFVKVLTSPEFYAALGRSLAFSLLVLSIQIPLGIFIALRMPKSGPLVAAGIVLLAIPMLTPQIVVGYLWKVMAAPETGLLTQALGAVGLTLDPNSVGWTWVLLVAMDTWHWTGLVVLLCYARLRTIPDAYYQAAAVDGAGRWAVFRHVQLPRLKLVLAIALLLRFMDSFTLYTEAYVITRGGPGLSTVFLSHELVQTGLIQFDLGEAGAMAVIYFLIVVVVSAFFYRLIVPARADEARR
ncbi:ABC transporter permease subunit [Alphaproteobacteria bacterium GH1-50]|uniref:ABC transporter permease subunit n=1 Tax=Kangsaoukella pontilimi TaxID=2691042 RepID=A0A7C9M9P2_9RHOB|nr:sugar ABC transporter permease [Kangsaoukella pontilimi]MXQ07413.1 ABC transporter permease subunit [Kangsaoukella pontilimi]